MTLPLSPNGPYTDPVSRSSDVNVPPTNSSFVEYEVFLQSFQQRVSSDLNRRLGIEKTLAASLKPQSRSRTANSEPPTEAIKARTQASQAQQRGALSVLTAPSTEQRRSKRTRSVSSDGQGPSGLAAGQVSRPRLAWSMEPTTILSAATRDPFNAMPGPTDAHVDGLVHFYINGDLLLNMQLPPVKGLRDNVLALRRDMIFPMVTRNRAAFGALVAYIETTPKVPIRSSNELFLRWHMNLALSLTNVELQDPTKVYGDEIINTIVLLMIIAQRQNDYNTFIAHAQGLMVLTQNRQRLRTGNATTNSTPQQLTFSWRDKPALDSAAYPTPITPTTLALPVDLLESSTHFSRLVSKGLVSASFAQSHQYALVLNKLAGEARFDWTLALAIAQHLWTDGGTPEMRPLERACHCAVRLCMHLNVWPVAPEPCILTLRQAALVRAALRSIELDLLFWQAPDLLMWLALVTGPTAVGHARAWLAWVLGKAQALCGIEQFRDAVSMFQERYAWSPAMGLAAEAFWMAVVYPGALAPARQTADRGWDERHCKIARELVAQAAAPVTRYCAGPWTKVPGEAVVREVEEGFLASVAENVVCQTDAMGVESCRLWEPPSPACLQGRLCPAHGSRVKVEPEVAEVGELDLSGFKILKTQGLGTLG